MYKLVSLAFATVLLVVSGFAQGQIVFNSIPSPMPANLGSLGFQATQTNAVGDRIVLSGTARNLVTVTQTMSSWGCQSGAWYSGNCVSAPGATFAQPLTLTLFTVGAGGSVGTQIATTTQTFNIPYRPSADPVNCTGGRWFNTADGECYNGFAYNATFNFPGVLVPNQVIYRISYNTSNYGTAPYGTQPCASTPQGCPYDSLNVALEGNPTVGSMSPIGDAYYNSPVAANYCDGGAGGVGVFRLDSGCWTDPEDPTFSYKLSVRFNAVNIPSNANSCKNDGWQTRMRLDGSAFKNQGDCVSYANNGK